MKKVSGVIVSFLICWFTVFFIKGYVELIENQSNNVLVFYSLICVFVVWKLGDFLNFSLQPFFREEVKK